MSWGLVRHALNEGGERASVNVEIDRPSGEAVQSSTRTAVLVLGMHRSGTSSLAGTLVKLGGTAPLNLVPADPDNTRGFWKSWVLMALNDEFSPREEAIGKIGADSIRNESTPPPKSLCVRGRSRPSRTNSAMPACRS